MAGQGDQWGDKEREAFWTFVRGRMAERRLTQAQVAQALGFDRSVLARRLAGQIKDRPTEVMIDHLADVLRLDASGKERLGALAGYVTREEAPQVGPVDGGEETAAPNVGRRTPRLAVFAVLVVVVGAVAYLLTHADDVSEILRGRASLPSPDRGTVAGWVLFEPRDTVVSSAWVTIWYLEPGQGWRDRSVQLHEGQNRPGCARYLHLAGLETMAGSCYEFANIPMSGTVQVRVHYASGLIRDYYTDPLERDSISWVGVTREE